MNDHESGWSNIGIVLLCWIVIKWTHSSVIYGNLQKSCKNWDDQIIYYKALYINSSILHAHSVMLFYMKKKKKDKILHVK